MSVLTDLEISQRLGQTGRSLTDLARVLHDRLEPATQMCLESLANGGKILVCGNGGSAAQAQHLVAELVVRFETDRRAIAAVACQRTPVCSQRPGTTTGMRQCSVARSRRWGTLGTP